MGRKTAPKWIRDLLPRRCYNCGATEGLTYHHIVPVIPGSNEGGQEVPSNYAVLCDRCHKLVHYGPEVADRCGNSGELVKVGMAAAKEKGVQLGPKSGVHAKKDWEKVMRLIAEKSTQFNVDSLVTEHEIMDEAGVRPVCYNKCKNMLLDAMELPEWPYAWAKPKRVRNYPLYERVIISRREERGA